MAGTTVTAFSLRTCGHASLYLAEIPGLYHTRAYQIVLGGGDDAKNLVQIISEGIVVKEATVPDITSCSSFKDYIIFWKNGLITVGTGIPSHVLPIISWQDPAPHLVNAIAFMTGGNNLGEWHISTHHGLNAHQL